ncbi:hypothetical protein [Lichenicola sp.]|uniref:hypothetical protein n=1 Tax=Lichenicola sp. TaxID=2804529 RepID=UPI003B00B594
MPTMTGKVTIVQESRFQLTDENGVSHLFTLGHGSMAEPEQLAPLQHTQARVRVTYMQPRNIIGMVAKSIEVADASGN